MHSGQRSQELAIRSSDRAQGLLQDLVNRFSSADGDNFGGLTRALYNSPRLRGRFREVEQRDLDALASLTCLGIQFLHVGRIWLPFQCFNCSQSSVAQAGFSLLELRSTKVRHHHWGISPHESQSQHGDNLFG